MFLFLIIDNLCSIIGLSNTFIFIFFPSIFFSDIFSAITFESSFFSSFFTSLLASATSLFSAVCFSSVLFSFSSGNNRFNKIPTIAAKLIPEIVTDKSPDTIDIAAPPNPKTSIVDATTIFFGFPKSIWFSIKTFKPFTDINP